MLGRSPFTPLVCAAMCALLWLPAAGRADDTLVSVLGRLLESARSALQKVEVPGPCLSIGSVDFGRLENGVRLRPTPGIRARSTDVWGTPETVRGITRAAQVVEALYPGRGDLVVTDISRAEGGHLRPHRTHQNGRDVDVLLYANSLDLEGAKRPRDLDLERLWALLVALRADDEVMRILLDRGVQARLRTYGRVVAGAPPDLLEAWFSGREAWIRHVPGHRTHLHVRFRASASAEAAFLADAARGLERVQHRVRRGETLEALALRFEVTAASIAAENRLPANARLRRGQPLFILRPRPVELSRPVAVRGPRGG